MTQPTTGKTQRTQAPGSDVASPHFRFPVKNESRLRKSKETVGPKVNGPAQSRLRIDDAHPQMAAPHNSALVLEQFVGWSQITISTWESDLAKKPSGNSSVEAATTGHSPPNPAKVQAPHFAPDRDPYGQAIHKTGSHRITSNDTSPREVTGKPLAATSRTLRPAPELVSTPADPGIEKRLGNGIRVRISKQGDAITSVTPLPDVVAEKLSEFSAAPVPPAMPEQIPEIGSIRLFPEPAWPFISELLLGAGWPFISRLAEGMDRILSGRTRRILVSGIQRSVGTTTLVLTLARWAAANKQKVLVIDADMQSAGLTRILGEMPGRAWPSSADGEDFVRHGTIRTSKSGIAFATTGTIRERQMWPPFLLDRLGGLLDSTGDLFDLVLIDAGPVNQIVAELTACRLLTPCAMVVSGGNASEEPMIQSAHRRLVELGAERILAARNFSAQPLQRPAS